MVCRKVVTKDKVCSKCGSPNSSWWRHNKQGLTLCHKCYCKTDQHKLVRKHWYDTHLEHKRQYDKVWYLENRECVINRVKVYQLETDYPKIRYLERLAT